MPKETLPNQLQKSDPLRHSSSEASQPIVLPKGELFAKFRILTPAEVEKLGLTKKKKIQEQKDKTAVLTEQAKEILGKDMLGPEAVNATFGFSPEAIPPIPFSIEDLERAKELNQFLDSQRVYILEIDEETAEFYAKIYWDLKKKGNPIPTNDMWVAASAMRHGLSLFTYDEHFNNINGLILQNIIF